MEISWELPYGSGPDYRQMNVDKILAALRAHIPDAKFQARIHTCRQLWTSQDPKDCSHVWANEWTPPFRCARCGIPRSYADMPVNKDTQ